MIDWARIGELRQETGEEDFREIVELFIAEVSEALAALDQAGSRESCAATLHFLRGAALNLGFAALAKQCEVAEGVGRANSGALAACFAQSKRALFEERAGGVIR